MPDPKKPKNKPAPAEPVTDATAPADTPVATAEPPKKGKPKKVESKEREVIYPEVELLQCSGENALTAELMKQLVGHEIVPEGAGKDAEFLYVDCQGNKVRFRHNIGNRPFDPATYKKYKQVVLRKHWCGPNGNGGSVNGEAIIVGKTGICLSIQHRAAALIDAALEWSVTPPDSERGKELRAAWATEPVMDSIVVRGVDETTEVTRTIDDVRASTLDDVMFKEGDIFARDKGDVRRAKCKQLSNAIRCLWDRTGMSDDAYNPGLKMTHTDALDYLDNHKKLSHCVNHVYSEWKDQKPEELFLQRGLASGLMYLMAVSGTENRDKYLDAETRTEKRLDLSKMPDAERFIVELASDAHKSSDDEWIGFRAAFASAEDLTTGLGETREEQSAIIAKAWSERQAGNKWKRSGSNLVPEYVSETVKNDEGEDVVQIVSLQTPYPTIGGVDLGPASGRPKKTKNEDDEGEDDEAEETDEPDKPRIPTREEQLAKLRREHKGKVLIFQAGKGLAMYGKCVEAAVRAGVNMPANRIYPGTTLQYSTYPAAKLQEVLDALHGDKRSAVVVSETGEIVTHDAP